MARGVERALADLWARTTAGMTPEARVPLKNAVNVMTESWPLELGNQIVHRVPDPVDYLEMRRQTFGSDLTLGLCRAGHGPAVPPEVYRSGPVRSLENAAIDYACLLNDVFSYQKEIEFEGEVHNAILVVQNFFGCDYPKALGIVHDLMSRRMEQFEHVVAHELPVLYEDFGLSQEARAIMRDYVLDLQNWMAGILHWHRSVNRYKDAWLSGRTHGFLPGRTPAVPMATRT
ncbi:terpene synthase family protein [Streptomyces hirsutus]